MKVLTYICAIGCCLMLSGCFLIGPDDDSPMPQQNYTAVVMDRSEFEAAIQILPPREVANAGKIYIKDGYLFINDVNKGFHVYEYSTPQTPVEVAFIQVPGATDLAVRGTLLYINQAVDLIALNYNSTAGTITLTKRIQNVFPQKAALDFSSVSLTNNQIIVDWVPTN